MQDSNFTDLTICNISITLNKKTSAVKDDSLIADVFYYLLYFAKSFNDSRSNAGKSSGLRLETSWF